ncbi:MAG TPA: restriction endonuclease [Rhodanobacteraceae bacterium]|jgi:restriction system protein|nr:restriction endonuclease [Rhodanobacteraceae bacterium]
MARHKQGGFDLIASMSWPVGIVFGIVAFVAVRYGIGWFLSSSSNIVLAPLSKAASGGATAPFAWILLGICWAAALASFIAGQKRKKLLEAQTGLDSVRAMSWREFEMLVGEAFRRQGYNTEETGLGGADGGIDLILRKNGKTTLVQCKQWRSQRVDVKVVREMYGLLAHHGADAVKIVAVGDFTPDAQRFVQGKNIELIHGAALLAMVRNAQERRPDGVPHTDQPVSEEAATPDCPSCGTAMVKRANRRTHDAFWGCPKYPACRGTRPA